VRFLIMVQSNPSSRAYLESLTEAEQEAFGRAHLALDSALLDSGHLVASQGLADPAEARRVTVRDGAVVATDGPFAEVKEHLAGFYLVDCTDLDEAISIAARVPDAAFTHVEVRPVLDFSAWEE